MVIFHFWADPLCTVHLEYRAPVLLWKLRTGMAPGIQQVLSECLRPALLLCSGGSLDHSSQGKAKTSARLANLESEDHREMKSQRWQPRKFQAPLLHLSCTEQIPGGFGAWSHKRTNRQTKSLPSGNLSFQRRKQRCANYQHYKHRPSLAGLRMEKKTTGIESDSQ